jgi:nitrite reductase/ring-hydroxylating ferredoxin subunit
VKPSKLINLADLNPAIPKRVSIPGRDIALFRIGDEVFALDDQCPHKGAPLSAGHVEDGCVTCPFHGWHFDVRTGACADVPARPAAVIPLRIQDGQVFLAEA